MDLLRSSIKAIFHDFNPSTVATATKVEPETKYEEIENNFYDQLRELLSWREDKFTSSEAVIYTKLIHDSLLVDDETGFESDSAEHYTPYERIFLILTKCGEKILDIYGSQPKVKFENLLRWRDLSLCVGEDALIVSTLARHDALTGKERSALLWPNVLGHNNMIINHIISRTLSDTHAHLWASTNVFEFNWMAVMNHPEILNLFEKDAEDTGFLEAGFRRYYDRVSRFNAINLNMADWIAVAAYIRINIFQLLSDSTYLIDKEKIENLTTLNYSNVNLKNDLITDFKSIFDKLIDKAAKTVDEVAIDYAITDSPDNSPFSALEGERKFLYSFFLRYFNGDKTIRQLAPWMYLYLLIRNKVRREFVQINGLKGFLNFETYQNLKLCFVDILEKKSSLLYKAYKNASLRYAIQSSIIGSNLNYFEARISPDSLTDLENSDYKKAIFSGENIIDETSKHLSFVIHFIKKRDEREFKDIEGEIKHKLLRDKLNIYLKDLDIKLDETLEVPVVGFDAAGNELMAEPEVFAPTFRYLREKGYTNLTYHVGEDFYDIIHGLRSVDEAIEFLELTTGNRIGHGLALGVDAERYYHARHHIGVMPKQVLLDNCVWFKYRAMDANITLQPETLYFIETQFEQLSGELGYKELLKGKGNLTMFQYWVAMQLRGKDPLKKEDLDEIKEESSKMLLKHYWESSIVFRKGSETQEAEFPKSLWIDVEKLQQVIIKEVEEKGITIETNPSSNVLIGPFKRYEELPLFRLHSPGYNKGIRIPVTVNTDDKGIFATSLENEYSIVALSLRKMKDEEGNRKWNDKEIEDYLRQLAEYGEMTRFHKLKP